MGRSTWCNRLNMIPCFSERLRAINQKTEKESRANSFGVAVPEEQLAGRLHFAVARRASRISPRVNGLVRGCGALGASSASFNGQQILHGLFCEMLTRCAGFMPGKSSWLRVRRRAQMRCRGIERLRPTASQLFDTY